MKYAGLWSLLSVWLLVVLPFYFSKKNIKNSTISQATESPIFLAIINIGLFVGAVFQLLFWEYLFGVVLESYVTLASILYLTTIIATFVAILVPFYWNKRIHTYAVRYYFLTIPIAIVLFGVNIFEKFPIASYFSIITSCIYILTTYKLFNKQENSALLEIVNFAILSLWTVAVVALV